MARELYKAANVSRSAAVVLSAAFAAAPAVSQPRPLISLGSAITVAEEQELFVRDTAPNLTTAARAHYGQLFTELLPPVRYPDLPGRADFATGALGRGDDVAEDDSAPPASEPPPAEPASSEPASDDSQPAAASGEASAIPAEQDPNYKRWEAEAKRRQQEEDAQNNPKESPLAAEHPDSYITVCEAGCREKIDKIVYKVAKAEAANAQPRGYKPTSAGADDDEGGDASTDKETGKDSKQADTLDQATIDCVAGCYDRPKTTRARPNTASAQPEKRPTVLAAATASATPSDIEPAKNHAASVTGTRAKLDRTSRHAGLQAKSSAATASATRSKTQSLVKKSAQKPGWRTKLVRASELDAAHGKWTTRVLGANIDVAAGHWKIKTTRYARVSLASKQR